MEESAERFAGVMLLPKFWYVATEDLQRARELAGDMKVIEDWRLMPGCHYATTYERRIPAKP